MKKQKSDTDEVLENIADAVIENNKTLTITCEDPFDVYVQRVQSCFFSDENAFRERFIKGYHTLIKELENR